MKTISVRLASRSYADEGMVQMLMAIPGIYNAYIEGDRVVLEIDEAAIQPAEAVRRVMDLGYELVLPHYVFSIGRGDPWRVKELVEGGLPPHVVAAAFDVDTRLAYVAVLPGVGPEEAGRYLADRGLRAELVDSYQKPIRLSFG
ncbi:hypothetical protein TUZN_1112 [Thermoproteus uzoniensis 768-20]|uniref:Uncharacterized protein n=1 Tax=Thermoproteus uzoniensis (strain 768-20) TaxID=999630 RepID=F2L0B0_THEU7|nr:hypothetical protein [Thermoproteus uzoniensis]AEA12592.1 hypothetical protein TUZN_1112 [Thermoproteus uzoniensis 768-20]